MADTLLHLMDSELLHYSSGEEVHAGDRVQHSGGYATVVFVSDGESEEFSPGYSDYAGVERGIVLCDDDGNLKTIGDPDELLQFIDRG
jgi:hypothetical protein